MSPETPPADARERDRPLRMTINGRLHRIRVEGRRSLLDVMRSRPGLAAGVKECEDGDCGACTVLIDDRAQRACRVSALEADGARITTVEGLGPGPVTRAFARFEAFFCGACTPGQMMAAEALLRSDPRPSRAKIVESMSKVACRCGGGHLVFAAVQEAVEMMREESDP